MTHFLVSIMNKLNGRVLYETTNQHKHVYQRRDYVRCSGVVVKIAAINPVGRSAFSEGIEAGFDGNYTINCDNNFIISFPNCCI